MSNHPNPDHVNINAYTKFGYMLSICSQDIERKKIMTDWMTETQKDEWTEWRTTQIQIASLFQSGVIINP